MAHRARHRPKPLLLIALFVLVTAAKSQGSGWNLEAYESCGQLNLKFLSPTGDADGDSLDLVYQSDLGVLWLTSGSVLYKIKYSTGDVLASLAFEDRADVTVQSGDRRLQQIQNHAESSVRSLGISTFEGDTVAVTDRKEKKFYIVSSVPGSDELVISKEISVDFVPYSLTFDPAYKSFYATGNSERNVVRLVGLDGSSRELFGKDAEANSQLLQGSNITSIQYEGNTGTLFVLCKECGFVVEVTLAGSLHNLNIRSVENDSDDGDVSSLAFARAGSPMLLLTSGLSVKALCQDIQEGLPLLAPDLGRVPKPQTWFDLSTYGSCGSWNYENVIGTSLQDITVDPIKRSVWAVVDGNLNEYDLRGSLLRSQTKEMLQSAGLSGVASAKWMRSTKLIIGMKDNRIAVVDTAPREAQNLVAPMYIQENNLDAADDIEPPGEEEETRILRLINMIDVVSIADVSGPEFSSDTFTSLAYDSVDKTVLMGINGSVYRVELDGTGVDFEVKEPETGAISSIVYSPVQEQKADFLFWCESCSQILEVDSPSGSGVLDRRSFALSLNPTKIQTSAGSIALSPDGYLLLIAERNGEVNYYCSIGSDEDEDLVNSIRDGTSQMLDPLYYWRLQNSRDPPGTAASPAPPPPPAGQTTTSRSTEDLFDLVSDRGCIGNTDIFRTMEGVQPSDCQSGCAASEVCAAFSYDPTAGMCWLRRACNIQKTAPGFLTGTKKLQDFPEGTDMAGLSGFEYMQGIGCGSPNLNTIEDAAFNQCEDECIALEACNAFSYDSGTRKCYLKAGCSAEEQSLVLDHLSALKLPALPQYQSKWGLRCADTSLAILPELSRDDCQDLCTLDNRCTSFTHIPGEACTLQESCDVRKWDVPNAFTGVKPDDTAARPEPCPMEPTYLVLWSRVCEDETLAIIHSITRHQCSLLCGAAETCKAFTHDTASGDCELKASCDSQAWSISGSQTSGVDVGLNPPRPEMTEAPEPAPTNAPTYAPTAAPTPAPTPAPTSETGGSSDSASSDSSENSSECDPDDFKCRSPHAPLPPPANGPALIGGWVHRDGQNCRPWEDTRCGLSANPGLKVGSITWYRMFAHGSNPLYDRGDGIVEWRPYRTSSRTVVGEMYKKGSEILGYFDKPWSLLNEGDSMEVKFKWSSRGEDLSWLCPADSPDELDCDSCYDKFWDQTGEKMIYHDVRCFAGTGDIRVGLVDSTKGGRIEKDGYGYFNDKVINYRGLQWRFHPHSCPRNAREFPGGGHFVATAASSWIRSNIANENMNTKGLICDFEEGSEFVLGDRSFKDRMFDPADNGACLNLPNGEWTPDDKPFVMSIVNRERSGGKVRFEWRMEFNGWFAGKTEEWDEELFPDTIDTIVVGYTNSRSFVSMKLQEL